ncbi:MAG: polyprenyl synthetase family protein [Alphaproteobacteria bacterium]|nr:polyprenyl synthetase family protein [Alphaproteobacteria bacterium]
MVSILPFEPALPPKAADDALDRLAALLGKDVPALETLIAQRLESPVPLIGRLTDHIINAGGKRLRPLLLLAAARLCEDKTDRPRKLAAAVEFIHTATLLHDDVVDESGQRRGRPSANAVFGNSSSVLVGDFLYSRAFQLVIEDGNLEIFKILADASSVIAEGEILQLANKNDCNMSEQVYLEIISAKTAELFAASCRMGAVAACSSTAQQEALRSFGLNLGIAFQIIDDVLDYSARQKHLGKNSGDDFREGKVTLPVILAINRGTPEERSFWQRAITGGLPAQSQNDFSQAQELIKTHGAAISCIDRAGHYAAIARDALGLFADTPLKKALINIVDFTVNRQF